MKKYLLVWPRSTTVRHLNYHFTQFGEVLGYLNKSFDNQVMAIDLDVENIDYLDFLERILSQNITHVVIYVAFENYKNAFLLARELKKVNEYLSIMAYGPLTSLIPHKFQNSKFDAVHSSGDFECAIKSFFKHYPSKPTYVLGSYLTRFKNSIQNKGEYMLPDDWGFALDNDFHINQYCKLKGKRRFVVNISRGCPYKCDHCLIPMCEGAKERRRSIRNLDEYLNKITVNFNHLKIWAANFTLDGKYLKEFCELFIKKYPTITWECATRLDLLPSDDILKLMYKAGCKQISLGIETIHENEIGVQSKKANAYTMELCIKKVQQYGIKVKGCIMLGLPNQTRDTLIQTLNFLTELGISIRPTIYSPYHLLQQDEEDLDTEDLDNYNRKTYYTQIEGVSYRKLLELVINIKDYKKILEV